MPEPDPQTPAGTTALPVGARLATRFVVRRPLGKGGMGVVFEAFDEQRGELVALKTFEQLDGAAVYRIKKEFRAAAELAHPNLVRLHELFSEGGRWFFTMARIEGVSFLEHVRPAANEVSVDAPTETPPHALIRGLGTSSDGHPPSAPASGAPPVGGLAETSPMPGAPRERELRRALAELAAGVAAIHRSGRVHRDLKPSNVLVDASGHVTILDFGLAREAAAHHSQDLAMAGTPAYMAPEQLGPAGASAASDWYAVGGMLYEALTGAHPFRGGVMEALAAQQQGRAPVHPSVLVPSAPPDLADLAMALLRLDPSTRAGEAEVVAVVGRAPAVSEPAPPSRSAPFVGREAELARLRGAFEAVREGEPRVMYVAGPSGIGKTALVERLLSEIRGQAVVLAGRCYEREAVPFKALDAVVDALSRHLSELGAVGAARATPRDATDLCRVFPVLERVPAFAEAIGAATPAEPEEVRRRAFRALKETFARVATARPLVIFIDDLQWGDVDSAAFLTELIAPPDPPRVLLLGAYRSDEVEQSRLLRALRTHAERNPRQRIETLSLDPLPEPDALALAETLLGAEAAEHARSITAEAAGNPFFVSELARARDPSAGATLAELVRARVAALPDDARALLEVVSLAAGPLRREVALDAAGLDVAGDAAIPSLVSGSLLRSSGAGPEGTVQTYHDRIRETVAATVSGERAKARHAALAAALERAPDPHAAWLALHHREAGHRDEARRWATRAASQAAAAVAFERAAELYRQALDLLPEDAVPKERCDLLRRFAEALASAGRGAEAAESFLQAAEGAPEIESIELERLAAYELIHCGQVTRGVALARRLAKRVGMWLPRSQIIALLVGLVLIAYYLFAYYYLRRPLPSARAADELCPEDLVRIDVGYALHIALTNIDPPLAFFCAGLVTHWALRGRADARWLALAPSELAIGAAMVGISPERVARRRAEAVRLSESQDDPRHVALASYNEAMGVYMRGDYARAAALSKAAEPLLASAPGMTVELSYMRAVRGWSVAMTGGVREVALDIVPLAEMARQRGNLWLLSALRGSPGVLARLAADEPRFAAAEVKEALDAWQGESFPAQSFYDATARCAISLYEGKAAEARDLLEREWPSLRRSGLLLMRLVRQHALWFRGCTELAVAASQPGAVARTLARAARRTGVEVGTIAASGAPMGALIRAGAAYLLGDTRESEALLERAISGFDAEGLRLLAAVSRARLAQLRGGDEGRALAAEALAFMRGEEIARPERIVAMFAPGFPDTAGDLLEAAPRGAMVR